MFKLFTVIITKRKIAKTISLGGKTKKIVIYFLNRKRKCEKGNEMEIKILQLKKDIGLVTSQMFYSLSLQQRVHVQNMDVL